MKRLALLLLFLSGPLFGQTPVAALRTFSTSSVSADTQSMNENGSISYHFIQWSTSGTVSTCQVKVQQSPTGLFAGEETDLIVAQTCTSAGRLTGVIFGNANYVRINVTVISGGGTVSATYMGFYVGPPLVDSASGRMIMQGAGSTNGLAQSLAVFELPNPIGASAPSLPVVNAAVTTVVNLKGSAGGLYQVHALNTTAAVCYIQIFGLTSGSVTLGTTPPVQVLGLPANASGTLSAIPFAMIIGSTGISVAATTTPTGAATCATGAMVSALVQ